MPVRQDTGWAHAEGSEEGLAVGWAVLRTGPLFSTLPWRLFLFYSPPATQLASLLALRTLQGRFSCSRQVLLSWSP